jgi:hypothetical protein
MEYETLTGEEIDGLLKHGRPPVRDTAEKETPPPRGSAVPATAKPRPSPPPAPGGLEPQPQV